MAERSEKIARGVHDAKTNAELLTATKAEYEAALAQARAEAQTIFQDGRKKAEAKRTEMIEEAKADVAKMMANTKKTMEAEKVKMVEDARKEVVTLAIEATKKLLEKQSEQMSNK